MGALVLAPHTGAAMRRCWLSLALNILDPCAYRADGQPDAAHIGFTENWLSKAPTGPRLSKQEANDPRILRPICRKHHHLLDAKKLRLHRDDIPLDVEEFANDFKLTWKLDREYGPRQDIPQTQEEHGLGEAAGL